MAFNSGLPFDDDKAQHEALVNEVDEREHRISTISLLWRPTAFILIPLALTFVSIYLGLSWTRYFAHHLGTDKWLGLPKGDSFHWTCIPNGTAATQQPWVWNTSQFLDITLGFGSFDFGSAKGIDIAWDLVVGRGGQILLALFSYRVLSAALLQSMENRAVSFYTYTAIGLDRGPVFSIWASLRDLWYSRSQGKGVLVMAVFASLYLLAFQTFVRAIRIHRRSC